jgi:AbrB family looped-hinge helix DNA binding protein
MEVAFTRMSRKGQIVVPKKVRDKVKFEPSDRFIVYEAGDNIVIKKVSEKMLMEEAEEAFRCIDKKKLKITPGTVEKEIAAARK